MSESEIVIGAGGGAESVPVPVASKVLGADVAVAAAPVAPSQTRSVAPLQRVFSFPAMLGVMLAGGAFAVARMFNVDPDLWWHIKVGENILATHHWPTSDIYSFTVNGHPWIASEWLGDVLLAAAVRFAGLRGLGALLIALAIAIVLAVYAYSTLRSGNSKAGFVASLILLILSFPFFSLRPQMLGFLFLTLTVITLERFRQGKPRSLWLLPPLFLIWVNTHGSWVIGLGTVLVYWASGLMEFRVGGIEARRWTSAERCRLEFGVLLSLAALTLTPYGTRLAVFPFEYVRSLPINVANIYEWQPMPFSLPGAKLFLVLVLGFFVLQMALRFTCRLEELVLFLGGTVMACLHVRFLLIFVPFFAPLFVGILARWVPAYDRAKDRYVLNAIFIAALIAAMVRYFPSQADLQRIVGEKFPARAVDYIREHTVPSPMYNTYGFGGYLVWSLGPAHRVFVDGRGDVFEPGGVFSDYLHIANLQPGAFSVLRAYGIQSCILERSEALATVLAALPDWQQVYSDNVSVIFVRRNSAQTPDAATSNGAGLIPIPRVRSE